MRTDRNKLRMIDDKQLARAGESDLVKLYEVLWGLKFPGEKSCHGIALLIGKSVKHVERVKDGATSFGTENHMRVCKKLETNLYDRWYELKKEAMK